MKYQTTEFVRLLSYLHKAGLVSPEMRNRLMKMWQNGNEESKLRILDEMFCRTENKVWKNSIRKLQGLILKEEEKNDV